jgi:hypothetical protein
MRHIQQETSARRDQFDCQLPEAALRELLEPKANASKYVSPNETPVDHPLCKAQRILEPQRARILGQPPSPPQKPPQVDSVRRWWHSALGWLLALAAVVTLCAIGSWFANKPANKLVLAPPPVVQLTPATLSPPSTPIVPPIQPAPRARLVRLPAPAPRAQLVGLPSAHVELVELVASHIDETHVITMPYGTVVRATLRGFLGTENQLPRVGQIGDMYLVEQTPWIWIQVPGTSAPTWVDP